MDETGRVLDRRVRHTGTESRDRTKCRQLHAIDQLAATIDHVIHRPAVRHGGRANPEMVVRVSDRAAFLERALVVGDVRYVGARGHFGNRSAAASGPRTAATSATAAAPTAATAGARSRPGIETLVDRLLGSCTRVDDGEFARVIHTTPVERELRRRAPSAVGAEPVDVVVSTTHDSERTIDEHRPRI